jgi:hypothetical protein
VSVELCSKCKLCLSNSAPIQPVPGSDLEAKPGFILTTPTISGAALSQATQLKPYSASTCQSAHRNKGLHQHRERHLRRNIIKRSWAFAIMSLWDCQSSTKYCAAYNFYTCTRNLHVLLSSTIDGFEYEKAGPGCCMAYCQICGQCAQGLQTLYSGNVLRSRGQVKGVF